MEIHRLPVLRDNYIFVLTDLATRQAAVVDPAIAAPVLTLLADLDLALVAIFNTHHHHDHIGGNTDLQAAYPAAVTYGGSHDRGRIPGQQVFLEASDRVTFADQTATVLFIPGHTRAHIAYYFPASEASTVGHLFCGDTLFSGGCGRLFEGTPAQMVDSLSQLRSLPDQTQVWCAHEYTLNNLRFARTVDPDNAALGDRWAEVEAARHADQPTIPTWLGVEKATNPFLRWDATALQTAMETTDPIRTFARLRGQKDVF